MTVKTGKLYIPSLFQFSSVRFKPIGNLFYALKMNKAAYIHSLKKMKQLSLFSLTKCGQETGYPSLILGLSPTKQKHLPWLSGSSKAYLLLPVGENIYIKTTLHTNTKWNTIRLPFAVVPLSTKPFKIHKSRKRSNIRV